MKHGYSLGFTWFTALFFTVVWAQGQTDILWGLNYPQDSSYTLANVFKTGNTGAGYSQLDTFPLNYPGYNPGYSAPVQTANGKLYGVLASGGYNSNFVINGLTGGAGVIYSFDTGTLAYSIVHTFSGYDGAYPWGSLLKASDGKLYGMCEYGDSTWTYYFSGYGSIFSFDPATGQFEVLHQFDDFDGAAPWGGLTEVNGLLYGMTADGGAYDNGVIFSLNPANHIYTKLYDFNFTGSGLNPKGNLTLAPDGNLYGLADSSGVYGKGTLFEYNIADSAFIVRYSFEGNGNGQYPLGSLTLAPNGLLYGYSGGDVSNDSMIFFTYNVTDSAFTVIQKYGQGSAYRYGGALCLAADGNLYGSCTISGAGNNGFIFKIDPNANAFTALHMDSNITDGCLPWGGVLYTGGSLYGFNAGCSYYWPDEGDGGNFFCYNIAANRYTRVFQVGQYYAEPDYMIKGLDGNLYMSASGGYIQNTGLLLRFDTATSKLDTLYFFADTSATTPENITQVPDSLIYGIAQVNNYTGNLEAQLFSFNPATGQYSNLHQFDSILVSPGRDNSVLYVNNMLYGTMVRGTYGNLYRYNPATDTFQTLVNLNYAQGEYPAANLVYDGHAKLYGATLGGGPDSAGVLFSYNINTSVYTVEHSFSFHGTGGITPIDNIVIAPNGNIFGFTDQGGTYGDGVVYCFNPGSGTYTVVQNINNPQNTGIYGRMILATDGQIYGSIYGIQSMFRISPNSLAFAWVGNRNPGVLFTDFSLLQCNTVYTDTTVAICSGDTVYVGTHAHYIAGTYVDTLMNVGGCDSIVTLVLSIKPAPAVPTITMQGHTLQSSPALDYRWFFNGVVIPGDTNASILATQNGIYNVQVTGANGCVSSSLDYDDTLANLPVPVIVSDSAFNASHDLPPSLFDCNAGNIVYNGQQLIAISKSLNADSVVWHVTQMVCYFTGSECDSVSLCNDSTLTGDTIILVPFLNGSCGTYVTNLIVCLTAYNQFGSVTVCNTTCNIYYNVAITQVPAPVISLYPNPTSDLIYIKTEGIQPQTTNIYDVNGQLVSTMRFTPQVDVSNLAAGVYLMEVTAPEGTARRRFVKLM